MKFIGFWAFTLVFWSSASISQTLTREELIQRIEYSYTKNSLLSAKSPIFEMFIGSAKQANPEVNDTTWSGIEQEIAPKLSDVIMEKGGLMDMFLRKSLESFSDSECEQLSLILSNPVYYKFIGVIAEPSTQGELMNAFMGYTVKLNDVINSTLSKHGLNTVH